MTRFCQSRNLFIKGEVAIQKKPKVASMGYRNKRGGVVNRKNGFWSLASCRGRPMMRNSVFEGLRESKFVDIQDKMDEKNRL